jgi:hypothetical protein
MILADGRSVIRNPLASSSAGRSRCATSRTVPSTLRAHVARGHTGQIAMRDSPLESALARDALTPEQYSAGQKYRHHW